MFGILVVVEVECIVRLALQVVMVAAVPEAEAVEQAVLPGQLILVEAVEAVVVIMQEVELAEPVVQES
jgi:hypothetical protein